MSCREGNDLIWQKLFFREVIIVRIDYPITFLYYQDLDRVVPFYRDILGLQLERDQGWCKIFQAGEKARVGLVDEAHGSMSVSDEKSVLLTLVVDDVDAWYEHLRDEGVEIAAEPQMHEDIGVYCFFLQDPAGYKIEIQKFMD